MIIIIPNWHPILVHFTIGLLSVSVLFYFAEKLLPINHVWKDQWQHMAKWSLWTGCLFTVLTVVAGWYAYNSVAHDSASHEAMTLHRNWAIPTAFLFLITGAFSVILTRKDKKTGPMFLSLSAVAAIFLTITGWLGAEAVYRYGLGVMSLPTVESNSDGHGHGHHSAKQDAPESIEDKPSHTLSSGHDHDDNTIPESQADHDISPSHDGGHHH